jgi:hypothetical protein
LHKENEKPEEKFTVNEWSELFENFFTMIPVKYWINYQPIIHEHHIS